jgi:MbtH protein
LKVKVIQSENGALFDVVINIEEQYSIWPKDKDLPLGWEKVGISGSKEECLDHIKKVWKDMRPKSLRQASIISTALYLFFMCLNFS